MPENPLFPRVFGHLLAIRYYSHSFVYSVNSVIWGLFRAILCRFVSQISVVSTVYREIVVKSVVSDFLWLQIIYPWKITGEFTSVYYNIKYRKFQVCGKLIEWSRYLTMSGNTCFFLSVLLPYFVNRLCKDGSWMLVWVIVYILFVYIIVSDLLPQSMLLNPLDFGR